MDAGETVGVDDNRMLPLFRIGRPKGFGILSTTRHGSGGRRDTSVRVIRVDGRAYLIHRGSSTDPRKNARPTTEWLTDIRSDPHVTLRIHGGECTGTARELAGTDEFFSPARRAFCDTVNPYDYVECALYLHVWPTRRKIKQLHQYWFDTGTPLMVTLDA